MALLSSLANLVNLLVHLSPVVVTILASTGNSVGNPSRMPGTNTGNLAETPVGLAGKAGDTPSGYHTTPSYPLPLVTPMMSIISSF